MSETIPVYEELNPQTKQEIREFQEDYATAPDGTVVKINDYLANPETPKDETK